MAHVIRLNKEVEHIVIEAGDDSLELAVMTDDASVERMIGMVGNAMDRFASLQHKIDEAVDGGDAAEIAEAEDAMVRLEKRCIVAIAGEDGYEGILALMSDYGEPVDPARNIANVGEVLAGLLTWLYERCTSKQLRDAGVYFERQNAVKRPKHKKRKGK